MENANTVSKEFGMSSNLKYWAINAEKSILSVCGCALFFLVLNLLMQDNNSPIEILSMLPWFIIGIGIVFSFVMQVSYSVYGVSLILSFGSTRKDVWKGTQWFNFLYILQIEVLFVITGAISPHVKDILGLQLGLGCLGLLFLGAALGQYASTLIIKFGSKGGIIFTVICVLSGMCFGFMVAFFGVGGEIDFGNVSNLFGPISSVLSLMLIVIVAYSIGAILLKRALKIYEVRV